MGRELGERMISGALFHVWCIFSSGCMSNWGVQILQGQDEWWGQSPRWRIHKKKYVNFRPHLLSPFLIFLWAINSTTQVMKLGTTFLHLYSSQVSKSDVSSLVPFPLSLGILHQDNYNRFLTDSPPLPQLLSNPNFMLILEISLTTTNMTILLTCLKTFKGFSMPLG